MERLRDFNGVRQGETERLENWSNHSSFTKFVQTPENLYLQDILIVNNEEVKKGLISKRKQLGNDSFRETP